MQEQEAAAREKLKAAQVEVEKLGADIAQMKSAHQRAAKMAYDAETALAGFKNLDNAIARHRSDALKSGRDPRALTKALQNQVKARAQAQDEIVQAADTAELLKEELEEAEKTLRIKKDNMSLIASEVLHVIALGLAEELAAVRMRHWELSNILVGLSRLKIYQDGRGYVDVSGFTPSMYQLLRPYDPQWPGSADPGSEMMRRWASVLNLLIADPDAALPEIKPIYPSDYYKGGSLAVPDGSMPALLTA